mmetsp:Transcript_90127/g.259874  ORF Transcript_90127/g.259874 Transcript_90127/m.259874 type:complete len:252 (+) Transcript_90127:631-1386(+)
MVDVRPDRVGHQRCCGRAGGRQGSTMHLPEVGPAAVCQRQNHRGVQVLLLRDAVAVVGGVDGALPDILQAVVAGDLVGGDGVADEAVESVEVLVSPPRVPHALGDVVAHDQRAADGHAVPEHVSISQLLPDIAGALLDVGSLRQPIQVELRDLPQLLALIQGRGAVDHRQNGLCSDGGAVGLQAAGAAYRRLLGDVPLPLVVGVDGGAVGTGLPVLADDDLHPTHIVLDGGVHIVREQPRSGAHGGQARPR